jgi:hypothetical protein
MGLIGGTGGGSLPDNQTLIADPQGRLQLNPNLLLDIARNQLAVMELGISTATGLMYDDNFGEVYSDSDGVNNSVNTGNTDALFNTNYYHNSKTLHPDDTIYFTNTGWQTHRTISDINAKVTELRARIRQSGTSYRAYLRFIIHYTDSTIQTTGTYQSPNISPWYTDVVINSGIQDKEFSYI